MSLKQQALLGAKWTSLSTAIAAGLQLLQMAILARFLEPSDFGLMAITMAVIGFSQVFVDAGISHAIVHHQQLNHRQLSTLYWLNVIAGVLLFSIVAISARLIAGFYQEPRLTELIMLVSSTFLMQPLGQQFRMLLQRDMKFGILAWLIVVGALVSLIVAVVSAANGLGVLSLAYAAIGMVLSQSVLAMIIGFRVYQVPSFIIRPSEIDGIVEFGLYQMGDKVINCLNSQIDALIIGKLLGSEVLGVYSLAKDLVLRPSQLFNLIVFKVSLPSLAKVQNDKAQLKRYYLKIVSYLGAINFPVYLLVGLLSYEIIWILYGEKWLSAAAIVQVLVVYAAVRSIGNPLGALILASGRVKFGFYWNLALLVYIPLVIYMVSAYGLTMIAGGMVWVMVSAIIPSWYFIVRPLTDASMIEFHWQLIKPLILLAVPLLIGLLLCIMLPMGIVRGSLVLVVVSLVVFVLYWQFNRAFIRGILNVVFADRALVEGDTK